MSTSRVAPRDPGPIQGTGPSSRCSAEGTSSCATRVAGSRRNALARAGSVNRQEALTFVKKHGVVLMAARGPVPSLAEAIAGEPIRGSWWSHPMSRHMYQVFDAVRDSEQVLVCRL